MKESSNNYQHTFASNSMLSRASKISACLLLFSIISITQCQDNSFWELDDEYDLKQALQELRNSFDINSYNDYFSQSQSVQQHQEQNKLQTSELFQNIQQQNIYLTATILDKLLKQTATKQSTEVDLTFDYFDQFLQGLKATTFSKNFYTCSQKMRLTFNEYNTTTINNKNKNVTQFDAILFSYTAVLSTSTADAAGECYTTSYNVYAYFLTKFSLFNGPTGIMESFLQNLLGNAIQFNNIYNQIIAAQKSNNTMQVYYQIGRILYLLIDFDPIEDSSLRSSLKDEAISYYTAVAQMLEERERLQEEEIKLRKLFQSDYERIILQQESIQTVYDKAYSFGFQFLNQSIGTSSPNSSICTGNITVLQNALNLIQVQIKLQYFDQMGQTIKQLLQTTGPLTYGCYYSLFEYFQIVQDYFGTIGDLDKLFYNIVHHMGNVYDNTIAMVELFRFGDPTILSYWKNLGYYFGNSLNQICYKPANYDPYRPSSR